MKSRVLLFLPVLLISCSFLNVGIDSNFDTDSGVAVGEPAVSQGSNLAILDDSGRYPAFAGIPLDTESEAATGRIVIPAADVAPGVVRGILPDGTPYIGNPNAPIILAEYADFACPHCAEYAPEAERIITELVRTGQARYEFNILTFVGGDYSKLAGEAALCAGEQGAFWEYRSELFGIQSQEGREGFNIERLIEKAVELGLNPDSFRACLDTDAQMNVIQRVERRRNNLGINSVPTLVYSANNGDDWQFFTSSDGGRTTRGSFNEVKTLVESVQP
ncbi:MAG: thioredoxin domain-containing protein [Chloroflexi bacterium]|nr:thioredoxin domain-containing protein [Chloroflexota bacterium]